MKKGFTLIELLAVIMILAIISIIALPIIFNVVEDAKKSAGESEANMVLKGITDYCEQERIGIVKTDYCKDETVLKENLDKIVNLGKVNKDSIDLTLDEKGYLLSLELDSNSNSYELKDGKMIYIVPINSRGFSNDDWNLIQEIVKSGRANKYYKVGDTKQIHLSNLINSPSDVNIEGDYIVRISNMSTPEECNQEGFSKTACGFVIEFEDIIIRAPIGEKNGYPNSSIDNLLNNLDNSIYSSLPNDLKSIIIPTYTVSGNRESYENKISENFLYLLSVREVWGEKPNNADSSFDNTKQLDYYRINNVTLSNTNFSIKKYNGIETKWWLRSPQFAGMDYRYNFNAVFEDGSYHNNYTDNSNGVSPAFRIG